MLAGKGDRLPVSAFPVDGTWPTGTAQWEKRNLAARDSRSGIRPSASSATSARSSARTPPSAPRSIEPGAARRRARDASSRSPTRADDFQGAALHAAGRARGLHRLRAVRRGLPGEGQARTRATRRSTWRRSRRCATPSARTTRSSSSLPEVDRDATAKLDVKESQFLRAALRVLRRLRRLRRDAVHQAADAALRRPRADRERHRLLLDLRRQPADDALHDEPRRPRARPGRTRCSRTTPSSASACGSRSTATRGARAAARCARSPTRSAATLVDALLAADQSTARPAIAAQRERVAGLRDELGRARRPEARRLDALADYLVKKSVWIVGGDGWAYDIGYGGLDHVLASGRDVNILVLDTEVYSNTGGQQSKATPLGAVGEVRGRRARRREEGSRPAGHDATATSTSRSVAFGAKDAPDRQAFHEAEALPGPSLDHRVQPLHRARLRHGARRRRSRSWPSIPASGRSTATIRAGSRQASPAAARLRPAEGARSSTTCATRRASAWSSAPIPERFREFLRRPSDAAEQRYCAVQPAGRHHDRGPAAAGAGDGTRGARRRGGLTWTCARPISAFSLPHPLMPGASPLSDDLDGVRRLEDAGAAAIVMHSLFEEQITREQWPSSSAPRHAWRVVRRGAELLPEPAVVRPRPGRYLEHLSA